VYNVYDIENRLIEPNSNAPVYGSGGSTETWYYYSYAPGNKRVWRGSWQETTYGCQPGGVDCQYSWSRPTDIVAFYAPNGQKLAEYSLTYGSNVFYATQAGTYYYFGGRMIKNENGWVYPDRLGSIGKFYPYGTERPSATTNGTEKFTGYFRDAETGNDYADQRYHLPGQGRFMTIDPSGSSWNPADPGSWNAYAYVGGDPINATDPDGLAAVTLPPVVPGLNCSTAFINYAAQFGETIQQLFDSDAGLLGLMSFFEQEGSGSAADQKVWAALDWTFLNQWSLSPADKAWFYGPNNIPTSFAATVTTGAGRSQVFTSSGQLQAGFTTQLLNILTGSPNSSQCEGLATAFDVAQGTINAYNGTPIPGLSYIADPVPGALQFGSNGATPTHGAGVTQTAVATLQDGSNTWTFYGDVYNPPPPKRPGPPRAPGRKQP
jgi:RHS repeat-associated protein